MSVINRTPLATFRYKTDICEPCGCNNQLQLPPFTHEVFIEISIRVLIVLAVVGIDLSFKPHVHYISEHNLLKYYKRPRKQSYVPVWAIVSLIIIIPMIFFAVLLLVTNNYVDVTQSLLAWTLALVINATFTEIVKLMCGRPRPDFFYRCFPDGKLTSDLVCTGTAKDVAEGRKSFPSGHSSFSFCSLGFMSLWLSGKLEIFSRKPGSAARVLCCLAPLLVATMVSMSRICDNHHHWEDVVAGSLLGFGTTYFCYAQYFNPLESDLSAFPYAITKNRRKIGTTDMQCCTKNLTVK